MTMSQPPKSLVLYADDDPDDLALIQDAFSPLFHAVELQTFADGQLLLHYLDTLQPLQPAPCLIILDINMPRMNGKEVLQKLRRQQETQDTPVVLFSTSTLPSEAAFAKKFNAGFVTKPLVTSQIQQIVEELLAHCSEDVKKRLNRR